MRASPAERLRRLLSQEIRRVTEDLEAYRDLLIRVWGTQRARAPMLDVTFNRWRTLGFEQLMTLEVAEVDAANAWYRELEGLRLYLSTTDDMPRALTLVYDSKLARLKVLGHDALYWLEGGPLDLAVHLEE